MVSPAFKYIPQTEATTFAVSAVFILLILWFIIPAGYTGGSVPAADPARHLQLVHHHLLLLQAECCQLEGKIFPYLKGQSYKILRPQLHDSNLMG